MAKTRNIYFNTSLNWYYLMSLVTQGQWNNLTFYHLIIEVEHVIRAGFAEKWILFSVVG